MDKRKQAKRVIAVLEREFPEASTSLKARGAFQFLIAVILSAQCTDKRVNQETPKLFAKWPDARSLAGAKALDVERIIRPLGFFRSKTKSIIGCARGLVEKHGGKVPPRREDLEALPGVGRKTANVVLGNIFGQPALAVDTHVKRVSYRLGLTKHKDPHKIEADLCELIPQEKWALTTHLFIFHGRKTCKAINPKCIICPLSAICPYYLKPE